MSKRLFFNIAAIGVAVSAMASPLTPGEALKRLDSGNGMRKAPAMMEQTPALTAYTNEGGPAVYVFSGKEKGYYIVSADDVALPLLGYSDNGVFDENAMSPEMKWWLGQYVEQIEYSIKNGASVANWKLYAPADYTAIDPLCATRWNQTEPYNLQCPEVRGTHTPSGCVAVAMTQCMKYFNYPEKGRGSITYTGSRLNLKLSIDFSDVTFDWNNMLDFYSSNNYNDAQANAVASLMKAVGYSIKMDYGMEASGASGTSIPYSLKEYFNYDQGCHTLYRAPYSTTEWADLIYQNLKNIGPVIINGQSMEEGGHSFVCDGYDGKGYYHFNWGWGGLSDGYFSLDALNPTAQGTGGNTGGFNFSQNGVFGIQPPKEGSEPYDYNSLFCMGNVTGSIDDRNVSLLLTDYNNAGYTGAGDHTVFVNFGAIIEPIDGTPGEVQTKLGNFDGKTRVELPNNVYYPSPAWKVNVLIPKLDDGKYKVYLATRYRGGDDNYPYKPALVPYGYYNYVILDVKDGVMSLTNMSPQIMSLESGSIETTLYYEKLARIKATFVNDTDLELTQAICPVLSKDGKEMFRANSILVTVQPKSTEVHEWVASFNDVGSVGKITEETEFDLSFFDVARNKTYGEFGKVIMKPSPRVNMLDMTRFEILDNPKGELQYGDYLLNNVYFMGSKSPFEVEMDYQVSAGYVDGIISVSITTPVNGNTFAQTSVKDDIFTTNTFMSYGETENDKFTVDFSDAKDSDLYYLTVYYTADKSRSVLATVPFIFGMSGVDSVVIEDNSTAEYYNLQGIRVMNPEKGMTLIERKNGVSRKVIF